jgi:benzodiazapine receptor
MTAAPAPHLRAVRPTWAHRHAAWVLAFFVLLSESACVAAAYAMTHGQSWYDRLAHPSFAPPVWALAPAWALMAAVTGIAAWRVWRHHRTWQRDVALRWWTVQLLLAAAWAPVLFIAHRPVWALVDAGVLVAVALVTALRFLPFDRRASAMNLAYVAWLAFVVVLSAALVSLN